MDRRIVAPLAVYGHEVVYVSDEIPGSSDDDVLAFAYQTASILITEDKDFGDLVFDSRRSTTGIILVRMAGVRLNTRQDLILSFIEAHGKELSGNISVVTPAGVRIRKITP